MANTVSKFPLVLLVVGAVALTACTPREQERALRGAAAGAAVSAIFGANPTGILQGAAAGGVVGGLLN